MALGSADDEIWTERGSLPWSWSASIAVIFPSSMVTRTCAAPYWVSTAAPVAVPETVFENERLDPGVAVAVAVAGVEAVAGRTAGLCAWKPSTPAVPAMLAVMTMGDRRIGLRS